MRNYWRRGMSHLIVTLCGAAVLLALVPLALILFYVLKQGVSAISWTFFTHTPAQIGDPAGGMANGIVGSLISSSTVDDRLGAVSPHSFSAPCQRPQVRRLPTPLARQFAP